MSNSMSSALLALRQQSRLLMLIAALERVGIAPVSMSKLHGFAYLADVLSPVWGLVPYDGTILKIKDGPHYADLQRELDNLVILGLVTVLDLTYKPVGKNGWRVDGRYQLRFESEYIDTILSQMGANPNEDALDPRDKERNAYLVELAAALSTLPNDEMDKAAVFDATYSDNSLSYSNVIDLDRSINHGPANKSVGVTQRFENFLPEESMLSPGEKVYLYASYLGRKIHA